MSARDSSASVPCPPGLRRKAVAVADANNDGILDLLAVQADGAIIRISDKNEGQSWETAEIASVPDAANYLAGEVSLHVADLDNNGALDLFLSPTTQIPAQDQDGALIWLGDGNRKFSHCYRSGRSGFGVRRRRPGQRRKARLLGLSADGQAVQGSQSKLEELSLAGGAAACGAGGWRPAHQSFRRRRRNRNSFRPAGAKAADHRAAASFRIGRTDRAPKWCGSSGRTARCAPSLA